MRKNIKGDFPNNYYSLSTYNVYELHKIPHWCVVLIPFFGKQGCCFLDRLVTWSQLTGLRREKTGIQTQAYLAPRHMLFPLCLVSPGYGLSSLFFHLSFCSPLCTVLVASFRLTAASKSCAVTSSPCTKLSC